jgi:hypothetical protein
MVNQPDRGAPDIMAEIRQTWQEQWGASGRRWEDHELQYRFALEMKTDQRYGSHPWEKVEQDLLREWRIRHADKPWNTAAETIREAWDHITQHQRRS